MADFDNNTIIKPTYSITHYTDQIFKIVKFRNTVKWLSLDRKEFEHYDSKLDCSYSRSRRNLLELALCNPWDWFCTFTIDKSKYDRYSLQWYKDFTMFIRDERKRGLNISYLFVPERHEDGAWHCHGFMHGDMELQSFKDYRAAGNKCPQYLIDKGFYNWPRFQRKFGFCSFGRIRSHVRSAFYISKYITKDNTRLVTDLGKNMFTRSVGLMKADKVGDVFGHSSYLDEFLQEHYEFCSVGMTKVSDGLKWHFGMDLCDIPFESLQPLWDLPDLGNAFDGLAVINCEQLSFV